MPRRNNFPGNTGITSEARRVQSGLTLLEMVLVVAILAVLAALGFSWAGTAIKGIQIQLAARSLFSAVVQTRNEAVVRNMRVVLCKSPTGQTCSLAGGWEQGWIIFGDTNNNASPVTAQRLSFLSKNV